VMIIELGVTSWCNYHCAYCVTTVQDRRSEASHAFDHHPVSAWVTAFSRVPFEFSLLCRGGEPFLDDNFATFLTEVGALPRVRYVRVDTNGSWSPQRYADVPAAVKRKVQLNVSFHPTQIELEVFAKRLAKIIDSGWHVAMINYVMEAHQADSYARVRDFFRERHDIYVNPNPDAFDPAWVSLGAVRRQAQHGLRELLPAIDIARKTGDPTYGKACFFPSIAYFVAPDGSAERACGVVAPGEPRKLDFIASSASLRPLATTVSCPLPACMCLDRYAFLDEVDSRGRDIDLLAEYVGACRAHQALKDPT
jgi:organic radical activating enzyme